MYAQSSATTDYTFMTRLERNKFNEAMNIIKNNKKKKSKLNRIDFRFENKTINQNQINCFAQLALTFSLLCRDKDANIRNVMQMITTKNKKNCEDYAELISYIFPTTQVNGNEQNKVVRGSR